MEARALARGSASGWEPGRALGADGSVSPVCCFGDVLSVDFCTQPPPFTYASRPKCSAALVVIGGFLSWRGLGVLGASEFKINRLQGIYSVRKQLQIYEQTDAYCKCTATRHTFHAARHSPNSALSAATHHAHQAVLSGWRR